MTSQPDAEHLRARALAALREVIDPEIGISIVDLGLVYELTVAQGRAEVRLTMTSPACPLGDQIVREAEDQLRRVPGIDEVDVALVWDPPWTPERMSAEARQTLGWGL